MLHHKEQLLFFDLEAVDQNVLNRAHALALYIELTMFEVHLFDVSFSALLFIRRRVERGAMSLRSTLESRPVALLR